MLSRSRLTSVQKHSDQINNVEHFPSKLYSTQVMKKMEWVHQLYLQYNNSRGITTPLFPLNTEISKDFLYFLNSIRCYKYETIRTAIAPNLIRLHREKIGSDLNDNHKRQIWAAVKILGLPENNPIHSVGIITHIYSFYHNLSLSYLFYHRKIAHYGLHFGSYNSTNK